jgi:DNA-binding transcriptional MerR regulator
VTEPEQDSAPALPVATVARRLGVAPATLRTWARRYGLGPSEHAAGAHRRYAPGDLARLEVMRRLTLEGVPPADAARAALSGDAGTPQTKAPLPDRNGRLSRRPGGPGGRVLALPGADEIARGLGRAAMALDSSTVTATLRAQLAEHGVVATWESVLRPVLVSVGDRWEATGEGVEVEHLLADCSFVVLREVAERAHEPLGGRPVLLAGAPGEQHSLPLHVLSAGLAERGVGTRTLGPALPAHALQAAVRRTGPALLFLWSQLPGTADVSVVTGLPVMKPPTAVVVGGPGWTRRDLPPHVNVADGLGDALDLVEQALGA